MPRRMILLTCSRADGFSLQPSPSHRVAQRRRKLTCLSCHKWHYSHCGFGAWLCLRLRICPHFVCVEHQLWHAPSMSTNNPDHNTSSTHMLCGVGLLRASPVPRSNCWDSLLHSALKIVDRGDNRGNSSQIKGGFSAE